jgi:integrase
VANELRAALRKNHISGDGYQTLKEKKLLEEKESARLKKDITSFAEFCRDVYLPLQKVNTKEKSYTQEECNIRLWLNPVIGHLPFKDVTESHLEIVKKDMIDAPRSPRTIQYVFTTFGHAWRLANRKGLVNGVIPTVEVKLPKVNNKSLRFFSHKEANNLLAEIRTRSNQWHDICLISFHTGMRLGEICRLTWGDVNLQDKTGTARDTKSAGRTRYLHFTNQVNEILKTRYRKQRPDELIFTDRSGEKIKASSDTISRSIKELGYNFGVSDPRHRAKGHTFRHTYASLMAQSGKVSLYEIKELLGHQTIQPTERYAHLLPDGLKTAASKFEDIIS